MQGFVFLEYLLQNIFLCVYCVCAEFQCMHFKALLVCHFSFVGDWLACHLNELGLLLQMYLGDSSNLTEKGNTDLLKGALELTSGLIQEIQSWASQ